MPIIQDCVDKLKYDIDSVNYTKPLNDLLNGKIDSFKIERSID